MKTRTATSALFFGGLLLHALLAAPAEARTPEVRPAVRRITAVIPSDAPPTYFRDESSGRAAGFAVDVMNAVAKRAGLEVEYLFEDGWTRILEDIREGKADVVPGMGVTEERRVSMAFTPLIDAFPISFFVRTEHPGFDARPGKHRVGTVQGSVAYARLKNRPDIDLVTYDTTVQGIFGLLSGKIEAFVCLEPTVKRLAGEAGVIDHIKTLGGPIAEIRRAIAVRKHDVELFGLLNRATGDFLRSPEYQRLYIQWYGKPKPYWTGSRFLAVGLAAVVIVFTVMTWWRYRSIVGLNRQLSATVAVRKQAEQALYREEERLRQVIRLSHIGIFDHDHLSGRVYWSPQQREIFGVGPDEPVSPNDFLTFVFPEDRGLIERSVRRCLDPAAEDHTYDAEYRIMRRDGSVRWLAIRSETFFEGTAESHRPVRTVGAVRDITEQRQAAEERQKLHDQFIQAQKMESIGRLAGGVAHDFNNMLSVILGHSEMVLRQLDRDSPFTTGLTDIHTAAQRSAALTRQLLGFARKQSIVPEVLDLNNVVERALNMLKRLIGEDITVEWVPGSDPWQVRIDPIQVDQVLTNLMINARDAVSVKGRVAIETQNVMLDDIFCAGHPGSVPGEYVMLAVSDDGCGMEQDVLDKIFEPFFTTKGDSGGTGLGLATVYGIVKQNGGAIYVHSELERGTTFKVYLPRHEGGADPLPQSVNAPVPAAKERSETILLVEDDLLVLNMSRKMLEHLGYRVLSAPSPHAAVRMAEVHSGEIHLLVTDVVMPGMNGRELAEQLRSRYSRLRTLYMSGYTANVLAPHGVLRHVHFLQKPFTRISLAEKVCEALG